MDKRVKIMRGLPGSGKSTWIKNYMRLYPSANYVVCSADDYFMKDGVYCFDPRDIALAHAACYKKFVDTINYYEPKYHEQQDDIIFVDNTNMQLWEMTPYIAFAEMMGYKVDVLELLHVEIETALARNIHGVSEIALMKMSQSYQAPLPWWNVQKIV